MRNDSTQSVEGEAPALRRGLAMLQAIAGSDGGATMSDIAQAVVMPRATAYRLLRVLMDEGFVVPAQDAAGRYVLDRAVFDALRRIDRGAGGEVQLTDAIALLISEGHPVHVVVHRGSRHDLGNPGGYLKAAVDFALDRDDYGPDLRRWLVARLGLAEN